MLKFLRSLFSDDRETPPSQVCEAAHSSDVIIENILSGGYGLGLPGLPDVPPDERQELVDRLIDHIEATCRSKEDLALEERVRRNHGVSYALIAIGRWTNSRSVDGRIFSILAITELPCPLSEDEMEMRFLSLLGADALSEVSHSALIRYIVNPDFKYIQGEHLRPLMRYLRRQSKADLEGPICEELERADELYPEIMSSDRRRNAIYLGGDLGIKAIIPYAREFLDLNDRSDLNHSAVVALGKLGDVASAPKIFEQYRAVRDSGSAYSVQLNWYYAPLAQLNHAAALPDIVEKAPSDRLAMEAYAILAQDQFLRDALQFLRWDVDPADSCMSAIIEVVPPEAAQMCIAPLVSLLKSGSRDPRIVWTLEHLGWDYTQDQVGAVYLILCDSEIPAEATDFLAREVIESSELRKIARKVIAPLVKSGTFTGFYAALLLAKHHHEEEYYGSPLVEADVESVDYQTNVAATIAETDLPILLAADEHVQASISFEEFYLHELINDAPMKLSRESSIKIPIIREELTRVLASRK